VIYGKSIFFIKVWGLQVNVVKFEVLLEKLWATNVLFQKLRGSSVKICELLWGFQVNYYKVRGPL
jgi:hypothetical protein